MSSKVALIGQINAGKSSLFNCLGEHHKALISKIPGTTRDRNYVDCSWQGHQFILIDLAGVDPNTKIFPGLRSHFGEVGGVGADKSQPDHALENDPLLQQAINRQIKLALDEADLILFLIDIQHGVNQIDLEIAQNLKKINKPVILVLNKADSNKWLSDVNDRSYWRLGFGEPSAISAVTGLGVGDLLDRLTTQLKKLDRPIEKNKKTASAVNIAIFGRPNVGKSSLVNAMLGEERVIVSPLPHTTGIRKKSKIKKEIERIGVIKSLKTVRRADVALFVLDINEPVGHQDKALVDLIVKAQRGLILVINKIDTKKDFAGQFEKLINYYQRSLPGAAFAPIIFISVQTKQNIEQILPLVEQVEANRQRKVEQKDLTACLKNIIIKKKFTGAFWARTKIEQTATRPPSFTLSIPSLAVRRKLFHPAQLDIIEKEMRKTWPLEGTPIQINLDTKT
ncbi:MAG: 50S ribosome-binding GTPase [Candidatus Parcubacteria bacterium]|nr:50S ribosome-binding GTPase [Candidatus Parcubacteria bacterium]